MADRFHELKCWPSFFAAILDGSKTFEVRKNDRDFAVGDVLKLREWEPYAFGEWGTVRTGNYTKRECVRRVTYVLRGGEFGIEAGTVVLGLAMDAERQKRAAMSAPAPAETPIQRDYAKEAAEQHAAVRAEARRDALEEVSELLWTMRKSKPVATPVRDALNEARDAVMRLIRTPAKPDPRDAELAKLRAVADAAATLGRFELYVEKHGHAPEHGAHSSGIRKGLTIALASALEKWDRDWRTKEGGR